MKRLKHVSDETGNEPHTAAQGETRVGWVPWHPKLGIDWIAIYYGNEPPNELLGEWQWKRVTVTLSARK